MDKQKNETNKETTLKMLDGKIGCQIPDVMRPLIKEQYGERIPKVLESIYT